MMKQEEEGKEDPLIGDRGRHIKADEQINDK
jgi:hypothetical protein